MKKLFVVGLLVLTASMAWGQIPIQYQPQKNTLYRLSNGVDYSSLRAIAPGKRDTTKGFWIDYTGHYFAAMCSLKVNSGGKFSMGYQASGDGTNYMFMDSTGFDSARATAGFQYITRTLTYVANVRFTFSNAGSDTVWVKFIGPVEWMR